MINFTENNTQGMLVLDEVEKQLQDYLKLYTDAAHKSWTRSRVGKNRRVEYAAKADEIRRSLHNLRKFRRDWLEDNQ